MSALHHEAFPIYVENSSCGCISGSKTSLSTSFLRIASEECSLKDFSLGVGKDGAGQYSTVQDRAVQCIRCSAEEDIALQGAALLESCHHLSS